MPRVLSLKQVEQIAKKSPVDLEVFAFGSLCIMAEGRCHLSSYLTDQSPNTCGACSPTSLVRWQETDQGLESRLNETLIDRFKANDSQCNSYCFNKPGITCSKTNVVKSEKSATT